MEGARCRIVERSANFVGDEQMGMSTSVYGIRPPDEKWKKMIAIWDSCESAGINPPEEVLKFFNGEPPDPKGVIIYLNEKSGVSEWKDGAAEGYEVDLLKLPKDIKLLRFVNSW